MKNLALLGAAVLTTSCGGDSKGGEGATRGAIVFPVDTLILAPRAVDYGVRAVGSVEAFERVQVTARVAGVVDRVRFSEGAAVRKGELLVEIEPARFEVAARSARALRERSDAALADARIALERREAAVRDRPGLLPEEELESFRTRLRLAEAEHAQSVANLDEAALNTRDAYVRAPVAGLMETRSVQTGEYVQPGKVLATLVRRDPMLLRFAVTSEEADRVRVGQDTQFVVRGDPRSRSARITHVGQAAEEFSRLVQVTAEVNPTDAADLRPGSFAEISVPVSSGSALVIPAKAARPTERGFVAYVIEGEVAHARDIMLGMRTPEGEVEVRSGLRAGDALVVRGAEALYEGAKVRAAPSGGPPEATVRLTTEEGALPEGASAPKTPAPPPIAPTSPPPAPSSPPPAPVTRPPPGLGTATSHGAKP